MAGVFFVRVSLRLDTSSPCARGRSQRALDGECPTAPAGAVGLMVSRMVEQYGIDSVPQQKLQLCGQAANQPNAYPTNELQTSYLGERDLDDSIRSAIVSVERGARVPDSDALRTPAAFGQSTGRPSDKAVLHCPSNSHIATTHRSHLASLLEDALSEVCEVADEEAAQLLTCATAPSTSENDSAT